MFSGFLDKLDVQAFTTAAMNVPYEQLHSDLFPGIEVWVRRDDLLDPLISGNKAYKLLYSLVEAKERQIETVVTCGGAWSNHIHATAAAGARFGFNTVGIIRGQRPSSLSATLRDAERFGMKLVFVNRAQYRRRSEVEFLSEVEVEEDSSLFVPEGGSNLAGVRGAQLLGEVIGKSAPVKFDQVWTACGTGATFAGLAAGLNGPLVVGVEVLKAGDSVVSGVCTWLSLLKTRLTNDRVRVDPDIFTSDEMAGGVVCLLKGFHGGGYAKYSDELRRFQCGFEVETGIPIDPIYTSKLLFALSAYAKVKHFKESKRILVVHSGGLQGRRGLN
ncbi:pyridoxal-phosphate dependent enzyme [Microbulbifer sp. OS29]|uniref:Pyridoxal-phosphate dependent enzyme n=1 Tax=Microbulbifer okhotskensis TaxID=2926617 RepID=A0A9X2EUV6_9GAMM|nr:pyridoxal-phosphate dependent enzyme [Microbulbifer okhotskensis]MCO1335928.1 pyridoxal-phosphate dependent enzyme [Microbulbifer okhotskensis]